jgi:hypothetical protein
LEVATNRWVQQEIEKRKKEEADEAKAQAARETLEKLKLDKIRAYARKLQADIDGIYKELGWSPARYSDLPSKTTSSRKSKPVEPTPSTFPQASGAKEAASAQQTGKPA